MLRGMFLVFNDNIVANLLWDSTVAKETEKGCVDALIGETARSLGDWAAGPF
jgi:hypothetical protein